MDDTEEAVRRLFAVATEDIPPGIDLARGVKARRRAHRTRTRALFCAGAAAILAAAGIMLSVSQAPSALAQVTQAAARTQEQSYRISSTTTIVKVPGSAAGPQTPVTISGEFDPALRIGEETTSQGLHIRYVGDYLYLPLLNAFREAYEYVRKAPIPADKTWLRIRVPPQGGDIMVQITLLGVSTAGVGQLNPQNLLAQLRSASQVRQLGPASGPGWTGLEYTFTSTTSLGNPLGIVLSARGTVAVDQQGRVRRLDAIESIGKTVMKVDMTFGDFGVPVSVSAPPASETFTP